MVCSVIWPDKHTPCSCPGLLKHTGFPRPVQAQLVLLFRGIFTQSLVLLSQQRSLSHLPERNMETLVDWLLMGHGRSLAFALSQHAFHNWLGFYSFKGLSNWCALPARCFAFDKLPSAVQYRREDGITSMPLITPVI